MLDDNAHACRQAACLTDFSAGHADITPFPGSCASLLAMFAASSLSSARFPADFVGAVFWPDLAVGRDGLSTMSDSAGAMFRPKRGEDVPADC